MTYDLRRLRLHGLIQRRDRTHRYLVTLQGWQIAGFYNTLYHHVLRPGWAMLAEPTTQAPEPLTTALRHLAKVTSTLFDQIYPEEYSAAA
jgi:hypothetical protein